MIPKILEWFGAAALVAAPFLINYDSGKILAIIGLALLTFQATRLKAFNLVVLNILGIIGYFWSLIG